jgi:hypothetical protein
MRILIGFALAALLAACTQTTTSSIPVERVEAQVRQACPAFRQGTYSVDSARSYGSEQATTFKNESNFNCRCIARDAASAPTCRQVRRFVLGTLN